MCFEKKLKRPNSRVPWAQRRKEEEIWGVAHPSTGFFNVKKEEEEEAIVYPIQTNDNPSPTSDITSHSSDDSSPDNGPRATPDNGPRATPDNGPRATPDNGPRATPDNGPRATPDKNNPHHNSDPRSGPASGGASDKDPASREEDEEGEERSTKISANPGTKSNKTKGGHQRPFPCSRCGKRLSTTVSLDKHQVIHTRLRPYPCSVPACAKRFCSPAELKRHTLTHTGERPFPCPDCDKSFTILAALKTHQRTHTGERPYVCEVCGKVGSFIKSPLLIVCFYFFVI
ncbi:zinc finger protein 467-like [Oncorhynchus masou masou]|uniref:zinc finger protein 467-like n=1 Tax=Oncorhynchus masou masou TaxID=90313 RepID=UPI00318397A3